MKHNDTIVYSKKELFSYSDIGKRLIKEERPMNYPSKKKRQMNWFYLLYAIGAVVILSLWIINWNLSSGLVSLQNTYKRTEVLSINNEMLLEEFKERHRSLTAEREDAEKKKTKENAQCNTLQEDLSQKQKKFEEMKNYIEDCKLREVQLIEQVNSLSEENRLLYKNSTKRKTYQGDDLDFDLDFDLNFDI